MLLLSNKSLQITHHLPNQKNKPTQPYLFFNTKPTKRHFQKLLRKRERFVYRLISSKPEGIYIHFFQQKQTQVKTFFKYQSAILPMPISGSTLSNPRVPMCFTFFRKVDELRQNGKAEFEVQMLFACVYFSDQCFQNRQLQLSVTPFKI